jgi:hypothetical protein
MPFAVNSGKHYTMRAKRQCHKCQAMTSQMCCSVRYSQWPEPTVPASYRKRMEWFCETCENKEEEIKQVYEPSDKARIFNRLLRIPEDYDTLGVSITSEADGITFKIRLPDYDMGEIRAIQAKAQETGFITADELIRLQKAGFRRPREVPLKPTPKDQHILRERGRQRMFQGEPRSI